MNTLYSDLKTLVFYTYTLNKVVFPHIKTFHTCYMCVYNVGDYTSIKGGLTYW